MKEEFSGIDYYEEICNEYIKYKSLPFSRYSEDYTYMNLMDKSMDENSNVCDLACGEGFYSRKIRQKTKGKVLGVDISEEMIKEAKKQQEAGQQEGGLGIEFLV